MAIIQVNKIMNSLVGQALGRSELIGSDASFVSLGDEVLNSQTNVEAIYNVMVERIGMTVNSVRALRSKYSRMRRTPMEWGVVLQKLAMPLSDAVANQSWNGVDVTGDGNVLSPVNTTKPSQKLFNKVSTWEYNATLWNNQLRFAFTGAQAAMAFLDMVFTAAYNSQEMGFRALDRTCRNSMIAYTLGTSRAVNLLANYNAENNKTLTVSTCLHDADFLIYAAQTISTISDYMEEMSRTFNDGTMDRHTPKDLQSLAMLTQFDKAFSYVAKSNVYHDDLVSMPFFERVNFWQGSGENKDATEEDNTTTPPTPASPASLAWKFKDVSSIDIMIGDNAEKEVKQSGIVATLYDFEALGTTVQNLNTSSMYNPRRKFTNYFMQADLGYFNDTSENFVVFYIQ